jgi:hypothetical protein
VVGGEHDTAEESGNGADVSSAGKSASAPWDGSAPDASSSSAIPTLSRTDLAPISGAIPTLSRTDLAPISGAIPTLSRTDLAPVSGAIPTLSRTDLAVFSGANAGAPPEPHADASGAIRTLSRAEEAPVRGPDPTVTNLSAASQVALAPVTGSESLDAGPPLPEAQASEPLPDGFTLAPAAPRAPLPHRHRLPPAPESQDRPSFTLHSRDNLEPVSDESSGPMQHVTSYGTPKVRNRAAEVAAKRRAALSAVLRVGMVIVIVEIVAFTVGPGLPGVLGEIFASIQAASGG